MECGFVTSLFGPLGANQPTAGIRYKDLVEM